MEVALHWQYEPFNQHWRLVAHHAPGYRAEIGSLPKGQLHGHTWAIYAQHRLLVYGMSKDRRAAQRWCTLWLSVAQRYPQFAPLALAARRAAEQSQAKPCAQSIFLPDRVTRSSFLECSANER